MLRFKKLVTISNFADSEAEIKHSKYELAQYVDLLLCYINKITK